MDAIPSPRRSPRGTKQTADTVAANEAAAMRKKFGQEGGRLHMTPIRYTGKGWLARCNLCSHVFEQKNAHVEFEGVHARYGQKTSE